MTFSPLHFTQRLIQLVFLACFLVPALLCAAIVAPGPLHENKTVIIPKGSNAKAVAQILSQNGAVWHAVAFRVAARILARDRLHAGEYALAPKQNAIELVSMLRDGHFIIRKFTLPEGLTSAETLDLLKDAPALTGTVGLLPPDGSLLPETYNYTYGDSRAELISRMQNAMQETIHKLWEQRDEKIPLKNPDEVLTLASVVEKETGKTSERPRIAGVFYNRLKINMRLQSDPTVIYALTKAKGPMDHDLGHADLAFSSAYNTYASDGLPPAPICNPGKAAIQAVLHPETHDYLYFVADGTGGHAFAKDLTEHNRNVAQWSRLQAAKR